MAKRKKPTAPTRKTAAEAAQEMETPKIRWQVWGIIALAFVLIWGLTLGLIPYIGYWGVIGAGVLTLVAAGFGIYVLRMARRSRSIVNILKGATDEAGRKEALAKLRSGKNSDAMNKLAEAQLVAQDSPQEAMRVLESIDLDKAPAVVQDDIRANLGLMYLMNNRTKEARALADDIRLDRQPQAKAKALYAAVVAEAFSRTGKAEEAKKLLETFDANDSDYGEMRSMLYRAQVYTYFATKNRGLAKTAMTKLVALDPNLVAAFAVKGRNPKLAQMAKQVMQQAGVMPKPQMRMVRR